ncbi:DUF3861 domain-containing protein [Acinetobacter zhairhuonensis]|uniref:DUF3861 domain-containing protein n=1 Tax=Acinetobacter sp. A7.4 TaxID=2919921 RepID=UPI001F4F9345|nr:DUF3861 domain-containing protein [Acinetobacter sp. A7.4]MCJ8161501.1 DUF3861 domain-containing protein [Acinetobacter sp. A7.4]
MKQHQYHITVEHLCDAKGQPSTYTEKLAFDVGNHDDILAIVDRMQQAKLFDADATAAFAVGLKLFGETLLENRQHPLFQQILPQFGQFMKHLKQTLAEQQVEQQ